MGANATALAELVIDFQCLVVISLPNRAIWAEGIAVLTKAAGATLKTPFSLLNGPLF